MGIVEGLPEGIAVSAPAIRRDLRRRSQSYGRSARQRIESDEVRIVSGLWRGKTTGAPVAIQIVNLGRKVPNSAKRGRSTVPRPGHADLAGCLKYGLFDTTPISERASARSTAMRVAIGAMAKAALAPLGVSVLSHVTSIGDIKAPADGIPSAEALKRAERSAVRCADSRAAKAMMRAIDSARQGGYTLGGCVEAVVAGVPPGLGSHVEWDRKLDARLAAALMSIQSVKAVEVGEGIRSSRSAGGRSQDAMFIKGGAVSRTSNNAGGIEGGISNGENLVLRIYGKPIPTVPDGLPSFDMRTLEPRRSPYVRSDVCAVPALGVISEAAVAWELFRAITEKFGGDSLDEITRAMESYKRALRKRGWR